MSATWPEGAGRWRDAWVVATVALAVRLATVILVPTGQPGDMAGWVAAAQRVAVDGVHAAYAVLDPGSLYPPAFFYPLWLTWRIYAVCCAPALDPDGRTLDVVMRLLPIVADAGLAGLVYCLALGWTEPARARWAGLLYALSPAVLATVAWQGMIGDPYYAGLLVLALLAVGGGRPALAAVGVTLAVLVKPQALAFVPLIVFLILRRATRRQVVAALLASSLSAAAILLPFAARGTLGALPAALVRMGAAHASTQNHADNVWLLLPVWHGAASADLSGAVPDGTVLVGGLTYLGVGLLAFAALYAVVLSGLWRSAAPRDVACAGAIIALGFFFLSTRMHANYVFQAFPFLCALAPARDVRMRLALAAVTLACLIGWDAPLHLPWAVHRANAVLYGVGLALLCLVALPGRARRSEPGHLAAWYRAAAALWWTRSARQLHQPELSQPAAQGDTPA